MQNVFNLPTKEQVDNLTDFDVNALKVYLKSVLSFDQDSVSLGGEVADQIVKKPKRFQRLYKSTGQEIAVGEVVEVMHVTGYVELTYLHILSTVVDNKSLSVTISPYYHELHNALILPTQSDGRQGGEVCYVGAKNYQDFWETMVQRETTGVASSRYVGTKIYPLGVIISVKNNSTTPLSLSYMGGYYVY